MVDAIEFTVKVIGLVFVDLACEKILLGLAFKDLVIEGSGNFTNGNLDSVGCAKIGVKSFEVDTDWILGDVTGCVEVVGSETVEGIADNVIGSWNSDWVTIADLVEGVSCNVEGSENFVE